MKVVVAWYKDEELNITKVEAPTALSAVVGIVNSLLDEDSSFDADEFTDASTLCEELFAEEEIAMDFMIV